MHPTSSLVNGPKNPVLARRSHARSAQLFFVVLNGLTILYAIAAWLQRVDSRRARRGSLATVRPAWAGAYVGQLGLFTAAALPLYFKCSASC